MNDIINRKLAIRMIKSIVPVAGELIDKTDAVIALATMPVAEKETEQLEFLKFLYQVILPDQMEDYTSMFNSPKGFQPKEGD